MKNKKTFLIIYLIIFLIKGSSFGDEFKTEATKIQILEKGNVVKALDGVKVTSSDGITIEGQESYFNKIDSYLEVYGNVFFKDEVKNILLKSDKIIYDKKNEVITSEGNVEYLDKLKNVSFKSDKTIYDIKKDIISSKGNMQYIDNNKNIFLKSDKINYNRKKEIINLEGNVQYLDSIKNIFIESDKIEYDKNNILIRSFGKTFSNIYNEYLYEGKDLIINEKKNIIQSKYKSKLEDQSNNKFSMDNFKFNTKEKIITANKIKFIDNEKNTYNLSSGIIDLSKNEIIGKDLYLEFNKSLFGDSRNDPRLKGNAITNNDNESVIYKGVFTTCKKKSEDKCPPWQISAEKVTHKKKEKIIEYKNAWLKIYDKPVVYFPIFFHPDPSVKRQSGFLLPTISNSNINGIGFQLPYYKVIADNKDLTFSPRMYSDNNILFQTEYRQANKSSDFITDFSFNRKDGNTKTHLFSNLSGSKDDFDYRINLESVSNNNYLKVNNIKSPIINDINTLNSYVIFEKFAKTISFEGSFEVIEDLTKNDSDKYEYIFPNYRFTNNMNNYFEFSSSGYQKQYNTNVNEINIINDIIYKNDTHISSNGFVNNITTLIRNVNSDADDSTRYKNGTDNKLLGSIFFDTSIPMRKNNDIFEPKFSLRYSPNKTKNYKNLDNMIDYNSIFSLDRFSQNDMVENDFALTIGAEYIKRDKNKNDLLNFAIANNIRVSKDDDLPKYQNFNKKRSDLIGKLNFKPSKYFDLGYDFSLDSNLKHSNYNLVKTIFSLNNFVTSFEFLEEDNNIGEKSFVKNTSVLQIDKQNFLTFKTNKDIDKDLTEYYNLIYEYRNDCLSASLEYNKQYYDDIDLKPETNLFFYIKLIPFGTVFKPNTNQ